MRFKRLSLFLVLSVIVAFAVTVQAWIKVCGAPFQLYGTAVVPCGISIYFVAGYVDGGPADVFLMKMNADGQSDWSYVYDSQRPRQSAVIDRYRRTGGWGSPDDVHPWVGLAAMRDGGAALVVDSALIRLNADGTWRWSVQLFPGPRNTAVFSSVAEHEDGDLFLCGVDATGVSSRNEDSLLVVRVSPDGQVVRWARKYPDFKGERRPGFVYLRLHTPGGGFFSSEDGLFVGTRMLKPGGGGREIQGLVARIRTDDGTVEWARSLDTGRTGDKTYDRNGLAGISNFQALGVLRSDLRGLFPEYDLVVCLGQIVKAITHPGGQAVLISRLTSRGRHVWSRLVHSSAVDGFNEIKAVVPVQSLDWPGYDLILAGESTECQELWRIMNYSAWLLKVTAGGEFQWTRAVGLTKRSYSNEERVDDSANALTGVPGGDAIFAGATESFSKPLPWFAKPQPAHFDLFLGRMDRNGGVGQGEELVCKVPFEPPKRLKFVEMPGGGEFLLNPASSVISVSLLPCLYNRTSFDCLQRDLGLPDQPAQKVDPGFEEIERGTRDLLKEGKSQWTADGTTGLIKVWASAYADIVEQFRNPSWIYSDQAAAKVVDYRMLEATGTPGAWYRTDITLEGVFKGIVDRTDYVSPAGGSATKYAVELVAGLAGTSDIRNAASSPGIIQRVWEAHNSLLADFLEDAAWAVIGGAVSIGVGAALPEKWVGTIILDNLSNVVLTVGTFGAETISADECVNKSFKVTFKDVLVQGGQRFTVYVYLHGYVAAVSTAIAAGVCELDFWHHAPHLSDSADRDPLNGRGFKLQKVTWDFGKLTDYPPSAPAHPTPADGTVIDIAASKTPPDFPLLGWTCADPESSSLRYHLYFGESYPPPFKETISHYSKAQISGKLKPNTSYFWKIVAEDSAKNRTEGPLWKFSTGRLNAPPVFQSTLPKNGDTGVPRKTRLFWRFADPNGDLLTYDLYLGKNSPPPLFLSGFSYPWGTPQIDVGALEPETTYYWSIKARDDKDGAGESPIHGFTTESLASNRPPNPPEKLWPPDGAKDVPFKKLTLKWTISDPEGDHILCSPQLSTSPNAWTGAFTGGGACTPPQTSPPHIILYPQDVSEIAFDYLFTLNEELERGSQYWWRVISEDMTSTLGPSQYGPVLSFRTKANSPPQEPSATAPASGAQVGRTNVVLTWTGQDPDGDSLVYDVYLSSDQELIVNPKIQKIASDLTSATYTVPGPLRANTRYFWEVVARDGHRGETKSRTFMFWTTN